MKIQDLSRFKLPNGFRGASAVKVQLWWFVQAIFFANSPQFLYGWRRFLLRLFGASVGKGVILRPSVKITYPWKLKIGNYSWIGDDVGLYTLGEIRIGDNVVVSQKSYLCTGSHKFNSATFDIYSKPIILEDEVWVATDVFIAPGIRIGKGALIGARSSVYKDMPANMICIGDPAAPKKPRV
jgi:putative colanic acid biosynthesis acetyltransferase WcaF